MTWNRMSYEEARQKMQPGDVIAFSGKGQFSEIIKWVTRANVSHVGVILKSKVIIDSEPQDGFLNQIIESTTLSDKNGVTINRLSDRIKAYDGEIWWLPLSDKVRARMDGKEFFNFLLRQEGKEYDMPQAIKAALDKLDNIPIVERATHNDEDFTRFFCSELVAAGLEQCGALPPLNASEVTPVDLCMFNIYQDTYYQLKGDDKAIRAFNTIEPDGWGDPNSPV